MAVLHAHVVNFADISQVSLNELNVTTCSLIVDNRDGQVPVTALHAHLLSIAETDKCQWLYYMLTCCEQRQTRANGCITCSLIVDYQDRQVS